VRRARWHGEQGTSLAACVVCSLPPSQAVVARPSAQVTVGRGGPQGERGELQGGRSAMGREREGTEKELAVERAAGCTPVAAGGWEIDNPKIVGLGWADCWWTSFFFSFSFLFLSSTRLNLPYRLNNYANGYSNHVCWLQTHIHTHLATKHTCLHFYTLYLQMKTVATYGHFASIYLFWRKMSVLCSISYPFSPWLYSLPMNYDININSPFNSEG
jgi:hypothetical protein